jgi:hypothetical protein
MPTPLFQKGNKYGCGKPGRSGRKTRAEEWGVQVTLNRYWKARDRKEVIVRLIDLAKSGNLDATKILLAYLWCKPRQQIEHTGSLEIGHYNSWTDLREHCESLGIDPALARQEVMRLVESAEDEE